MSTSIAFNASWAKHLNDYEDRSKLAVVLSMVAFDRLHLFLHSCSEHRLVNWHHSARALALRSTGRRCVATRARRRSSGRLSSAALSTLRPPHSPELWQTASLLEAQAV
jgi:hypothetical protein